MSRNVLNPKDILVPAPFQQRLFPAFALQEVLGNGHFTTGDICPKFPHDASENVVPDCGEGCYVDFISEVDQFAHLRERC